MTDPRKLLGQRGEALAEAFLRRRGMRVLARNFATPAGEIDRVMRDGATIVFVEVKTRADRRFADPEESVGRAKRQRMVRAAKWFLMQRRLSASAYRFDIVAVIIPPQNAAPPEIEHFADAWAPGF